MRPLLVGLGFLLPAMIVEPDFLEHWKTRLLVRLLGTEAAPIYVIRLWAHCQSRKTDRFTDWNPDVLASVCRWDGDATVFWNSMLQTFARIEDGAFVAHDWAECNAALISAWTNGKLGGRPTKKKPTENPPVNQTETDWLSDREDREDREDQTENKTDSELETLRLRIGSWFKRRPTTKWSEKEIRALKSVLKLNTPPEDIDALERWYLSGDPYLRRDPFTLLNNWNGEIDKARGKASTPQLFQRQTPNISKYTAEQIALMEAMG